jgi:hypothetical protein
MRLAISLINIFFNLNCNENYYSQKYKDSYFLSSNIIQKEKNLLNRSKILKSNIRDYTPIIAIATLFPNLIVIIILAIMQLTLSYNYSNMLTVVIYYIIFSYKNPVQRNIFSIYLLLVYGYCLYCSYNFLELKINILQIFALISGGAMLATMCYKQANDLSISHMMLLSLFIVYSLLALPYGLKNNNKKIASVTKEDYSIYSII